MAGKQNMLPVVLNRGDIMEHCDYVMCTNNGKLPTPHTLYDCPFYCFIDKARKKYKFMCYKRCAEEPGAWTLFVSNEKDQNTVWECFCCANKCKHPN